VSRCASEDGTIESGEHHWTALYPGSVDARVRFDALGGDVMLDRPLTPDERATLGKAVTRFPGLVSAVHAQVTRLLAAVLPAANGAIATD
jgi:hypothetical protein